MATPIKNSELTPINQITNSFVENNTQNEICRRCGKQYVPCKLNVKGVERIVYCRNCDCYEKEQKEKEAQKTQEKLKEKFKNANIGKRYENITLDKLEEMGTENVSDAKEYVKHFNPESGKSIHMIGNFGNGKTSLGYAIIKALLLKFNCVSITWTEFVTRCYYAKSFTSDETIELLIKWLGQFDLVMIDEFVVNIKDEKEINLATTLFDNLYKNNKCFILINNPCDIEDMKTVIRLGKVLDRIRHQAKKFIFKNGSYRR